MAFTKVFKSLLLRSSFYGISIKLTLVYMSTMYFDVRKVFIGLRPRIFEITGTLFSKDIFKDILISSRLDDDIQKYLLSYFVVAQNQCLRNIFDVIDTKTCFSPGYAYCWKCWKMCFWYILFTK